MHREARVIITCLWHWTLNSRNEINGTQQKKNSLSINFIVDDDEYMIIHISMFREKMFIIIINNSRQHHQKMPFEVVLSLTGSEMWDGTFLTESFVSIWSKKSRMKPSFYEIIRKTWKFFLCWIEKAFYGVNYTDKITSNLFHVTIENFRLHHFTTIKRVQ